MKRVNVRIMDYFNKLLQVVIVWVEKDDAELATGLASIKCEVNRMFHNQGEDTQ